MAIWDLQIPNETDRVVREHLARTGKGAGDLSTFVEKSVCQAIFWNTVHEIRERNKDLSPEGAQALADEAVAWARSNPA